MTYHLRGEDLDFLQKAPHRLDCAFDVHAPVDVAFAAISASPETWSWFPGLTSGGYREPEPRGVGSHRWVEVAGVRYDETILAWDVPGRWAYRVDECSAELFLALLEDWRLEPRDGGSVLRWTFAFEPVDALRSLADVELPAAAEAALRAAVTDLNGGLR
jgi:hypothetical protein